MERENWILETTSNIEVVEKYPDYQTAVYISMDCMFANAINSVGNVRLVSLFGLLKLKILYIYSTEN